MSDRELAKNLIDKIPNESTLEAFQELDDGDGHTFCGSTDQLFIELIKE